MTLSDEVTTQVVDVAGFSLEKLRTSEAPILVQSIDALTGHTQCSQTGVLQNQVREDI